MANETPSRPGQINSAGDPLAIFLKVFAGEVLAAFNRESAFRPRHLIRTIPNGKSAQFPATGLAVAQYHTPGAEILGQQINQNERVIPVEDLLIAPIFIANIDEAMAHYDYRAPYSDQIGQALAKFYDQNVSRTIINTARNNGVNLVTGLPTGTSLTDADYATDGTKLYGGVFSAGVQLDANDVPQSDRHAGFRPVQYALIVRSEKPINRDISPDNGSIATGIINSINGIPLFKSNNLVNSNDFSGFSGGVNPQMPAVRQHDYSTNVGVVFHRGAAGTVQLQDITMESAYDPRRQGTLMLGKYLVGHGGLRPEAAMELRTGNPAG